MHDIQGSKQYHAHIQPNAGEQIIPHVMVIFIVSL